MSTGFFAAMAQDISIAAAIPEAIQQKWLVRSASRPRLMRTEYSVRSFSFMEAMGNPFSWWMGWRRALPTPAQSSAALAPDMSPGCDCAATVRIEGHGFRAEIQGCGMAKIFIGKDMAGLGGAGPPLSFLSCQESPFFHPTKEEKK